MEIRQEIRRSRKAAKWTQKTLAEKAGLSQVFICKLEAGEKEPSMETLRNFGRVFREAGHPFSSALERLLGLVPEEEPELQKTA